jgi:hypothetical protein
MIDKFRQIPAKSKPLLYYEILSGYPTIFTILPGTTITFLGVRPCN